MRTLNGTDCVGSIDARREGEVITVRLRFRGGVRIGSVTTGLLRYSFGGYLDPFAWRVWHTEVEFLEVCGPLRTFAGGGEVELEIPADRTARGMVEQYNLMGTVVASGSKVDLRGRPDVVVMVLQPPGPDSRIDAGRRTLKASTGEGWAFAEVEGTQGGLRIDVSSGGRGFSAVKLEVERRVKWYPENLEGPTEIFQVEPVASLKPGSSGAVEWRPRYPTYEPLVAAISTQPSYDEVLRLLGAMGIEARREMARTMIVLGRPHYVLADLEPVRTRLRLRLSRRMRRDVVDETELRLEGLR